MTTINTIHFHSEVYHSHKTHQKSKPASIPKAKVKSHVEIKKQVKLFAKIRESAGRTLLKMRSKFEKVKLEPIIANIHTNMAEGELILNVLSCLPIIGVIGSSVRILIGKVQSLAGLIFAALGEIGIYVESSKLDQENPQVEVLKRFILLSKFGREHVIHGCLNVFRGSSEMAFAASTMGVGNLALLVPNLFNKRDFKPFVPYGILTGITSTKKKEKAVK